MFISAFHAIHGTKYYRNTAWMFLFASSPVKIPFIFLDMLHFTKYRTNTINVEKDQI